MAEDKENDPFGAIKQFFTPAEWADMGSYDKSSYKNKLENYNAMLSFGLSVPPPSFTTRRLAQPTPTAHQRKTAKRKSKTYADSDEEWIPARFQPPRATLKETKSKVGQAPTQSKKEPKQQPPLRETNASAQHSTAAVVSSQPKTQPVQLELKGGRYPRRQTTAKVYADGEAEEDDEYLFCDECQREWEGDCPEHGPLQVIADIQVAVGEPDRARRTVPPQLAVLPSKIEGAGEGVWTRQAVPRGVRFGPYEGRIMPPTHESGYGWMIKRGRKPVHCVDAEDIGHSNWMRYVNCARFQSEQNLQAFQYCGQLYYRTVCDVRAHSELLVWYGDDYAKELSIDPRNFDQTPQDPLVVDGVFPCQGCRLSFGSPVYFAQHRPHCRGQCKLLGPSGELQSGGQKKGSSTETCTAVFEERSSTGTDSGLEVQLERRAGDRPFRCDTCGCGFTRNSDLRRHIRTHTGEKPFRCDTCGAAFAQSSDLQKHIRTHTGEKPFRCDTCGAAFARSCALRTHIRTHTGEKPFRCDTCGAAFAQSSALRTHIRTHTGEKPFRCDTCGAAFAHSSALRTHIRTHTGEKPFRCDTCGAAFARSSDMRRHARTHAGENTPLSGAQPTDKPNCYMSSN